MSLETQLVLRFVMLAAGAVLMLVAIFMPWMKP